ncbi:hypothetical protein E4U59_001396 [Claviceps monticola]|nr:hypothetical protein E4U59_001396 [Claviceps monticola]
MREKSEGTSLAESLTSQAHPNQRNAAAPPISRKRGARDNGQPPKVADRATAIVKGDASCNPVGGRSGGRWPVVGVGWCGTPAGT